VGSKKLFSFLFFSWITLLTVLSLIPADNLDMDGPDIPFLDKWIHLGFYLIAMVLGVLFLWERFRPRAIKRSSFYWLGLGLAVYGMIIEVLQGIGGQQRSAELWDLAANIVGIGLGAFISLLILRKAGD
jgi:uncharacterized membrane protein